MDKDELKQSIKSCYKISNIIDLEQLLKAVVLGDQTMLSNMKTAYLALLADCQERLDNVDKASNEEFKKMVKEYKPIVFKRLNEELEHKISFKNRIKNFFRRGKN
jgi:hypothetical protein